MKQIRKHPTVRPLKEGFLKWSRQEDDGKMPLASSKPSRALIRALLPVTAAGLFALTPAHAAIVSTGEISPSDPSTWIGGTSGTYAYVGVNTGDGVITVNGGSQLSSYQSYVGYGSGKTGTIAVDGAGSAFNASTLYMGYSGTGTMNITNGGAVTGSISMGYNAGATGTITVDGAGSTLNAYSSTIGRNGSGIVTITNGGKYISRTPDWDYLGYNPGGSGTVTVDGIGSSWSSNGTLYVGNGGTGTLNIFNGSTLSNAGNVLVGGAGTINFGANGGALNTGGIAFSSSQLSGTGTINTSGIVTDVNLVFDASHGGTQSFTKNGITVNLNQGSTGILGAGCSGSGTLTIAEGVSITSKGGYLGYNAGGTGTATVTGSGSTWNTGYLVVGNSGTGSLAITKGGVVNGSGANLGYNAGSNGSVVVDGAGSALNLTSNLYVSGKGNGSLDISNGGKVAATGLRLGDNTGAAGTVNIDGTGSKLSIIMVPTNNGPIYLGYKGNGVLSVKNGGTLETTGSFQVGANTSGSGIVNIAGAGSSWIHNDPVNGGLSVGGQGVGALNITKGGTVTTNVYGVSVGGSFNTGAVNVSGSGSTWNVSLATTNSFNIGQGGNSILSITKGGKVTSSGSDLTVGTPSINSGVGTVYVNGSGSSLNVGNGINVGFTSVHQVGTGRLVVSDGAAASATKVNINSTSLLTADLGRGSSLTIGAGAGTLTNNGTIRLVAGAGAAGGVYKPISAGTWSGTGAVQALGGIWNSANHTVTVSDAVSGAAGTALTADLADTQRFLFTDGSTDKSVGAAFQATAGSANLTLTASAIGGAELGSLQGLVGAGNTVLSGWDFTTSGYTVGDPVYVSLFAGSGRDLSDFTIWHYDGSIWAKYAASDLAYDNKYASFTVNGFSGYAVSGTAPVPVPAAAWLLGSGILGLVGIRRRKIA
jgi:T5SS/PEP-CTERM-associated repeat protein